MLLIKKKVPTVDNSSLLRAERMFKLVSGPLIVTEINLLPFMSPSRHLQLCWMGARVSAALGGAFLQVSVTVLSRVAWKQTLSYIQFNRC